MGVGVGVDDANMNIELIVEYDIGATIEFFAGGVVVIGTNAVIAIGTDADIEKGTVCVDDAVVTRSSADDAPAIESKFHNVIFILSM